MSPSVTIVKIVGRIIGTVMWRNLRHSLAPSSSAASLIESSMFCSAARKSSMNVPEVVKTAMMTKTHMATLGPASQSQ